MAAAAMAVVCASRRWEMRQVSYASNPSDVHPNSHAMGISHTPRKPIA